LAAGGSEELEFDETRPLDIVEQCLGSGG